MGEKIEPSAPEYDALLTMLAEYVVHAPTASRESYDTARACLADALGCGILALSYPECTKLLGPIVPGTIVPHGCRIPGTSFILDPVRAAFNIGVMNRWLDFNDTWLAAEWGHPSDNIGGILAIADYISQTSALHNLPIITVGELLTAIIQAYEIQGALAMNNSFNRIGFDHVILVKVATTAVVTKLLGGTQEQICASLSNAWIDTGPLRTYRHAPNTGSRKSWAAGDATSRGVMLALMTIQGEMGYPTALSAARWGLYDVLFQGKPFTLQRALESYVMDHILFKISFPAEFHAQTAVECAITLHSKSKDRLKEIILIDIATQESAMRIIDKKGALKNPADRDHCLQYMVAVALLHGELTAEHYEEEHAKNPEIDRLRSKMRVSENAQYTLDYLDPDKRSIATSIALHFQDGSSIGPIEVEYPIGHSKRKKEGIPLLFKKFTSNLKTCFSEKKAEEITSLFQDHDRLCSMPVPELMQLFWRGQVENR